MIRGLRGDQFPAGEWDDAGDGGVARMDEAASYDLYLSEREAETYGLDPLQTRGPSRSTPAAVRPTATDGCRTVHFMTNHLATIDRRKPDRVCKPCPRTSVNHVSDPDIPGRGVRAATRSKSNDVGQRPRWRRWG